MAGAPAAVTAPRMQPSAGQTSSAGVGGNAGSTPMADAGAGPDDPACDLSGVWIAKQITVSEALGVAQSSNNWFYLELAQIGSQAEVTKHHDCGIEVRGTVTVTLPRRSIEGQLAHDIQVGRKATVTRDGDNCKLEMARFWSVRGADEQRFLPEGGRDSSESIAALAAKKPLPTPMRSDGAQDWDGDGKLGLAFEISGLISGTRNSVQRDWSRWFTEPGYEIRASTSWPSDLTIRADFDNEESVMDPSEGLLSSGSTPSRTARHVVKLRFLGRNTTDPRVSALRKSSELETCYAIQDALPAEVLQ